MVGMKFTDPHRIVMEYLTQFAYEKLSQPLGNKTAEGLAQMLAGMRITDRNRADIPKGKQNLMAREFLRGVLADHAI